MRNNTSTPLISEFVLPGHVARREWAVYVIIASPKGSSANKLYVGKVGDNRDGCNPIISRIGNHFSHAKVHSQLRNKIPTLMDFNYRIVYATFGQYQGSSKTLKDRVNELERELNRAIQKSTSANPKWELLNPHKDVGYIKADEREYRKGLLSVSDQKALTRMIEKIFG